MQGSSPNLQGGSHQVQGSSLTLQSAVTSQRFQVTASVAGVQGPGAPRSNTGSIPAPPKLEALSQKKGVVTVGISGSVGFGGFLTGSAGIAFGLDGSIGFYASGGGGGSTGLNTGLGVNIGYNKSRGVSSLRGTQAFGGVSIGGGPSAGIDLSDGEVDAVLGLGLSGLPPLIPFEGHMGAQYTYINQLR